MATLFLFIYLSVPFSPSFPPWNHVSVAAISTLLFTCLLLFSSLSSLQKTSHFLSFILFIHFWNPLFNWPVINSCHGLFPHSIFPINFTSCDLSQSCYEAGRYSLYICCFILYFLFSSQLILFTVLSTNLIHLPLSYPCWTFFYPCSSLISNYLVHLSSN